MHETNLIILKNEKNNDGSSNCFYCIVLLQRRKKRKNCCKEEVKVEETTMVNNVDLTASVMTWKGTKPTGSHDGTVAFKSGGMVVENDVLKRRVCYRHEYYKKFRHGRK